MVYEDSFGFRKFKHEIISAAKQKENFYFSQTAYSYFADYRPNYPYRRPGDFLIQYNWVSETIKYYGETSTVPLIVDLDDMNSVIELIKNGGY